MDRPHIRQVGWIDMRDGGHGVWTLIVVGNGLCYDRKKKARLNAPVSDGCSLYITGAVHARAHVRV